MKKKIITLMAATMVAMSGWGQRTVLFDFEGENFIVDQNAPGLWINDQADSYKVATNPQKSGINTSDKCIEMKLKGENNSGVLGITLDGANIELQGKKRISFMMLKPTGENCSINLERVDGEIKHNRTCFAWHDGSEVEWRKVYFDFSTNDLFYDPVLMMINPQTWDVPADGLTVYIDNIVAEDIPFVNNTPLTEWTPEGNENTLTLTGGWLRGMCFKENFDGTSKVTYNDFETLQTALAGNTTLTSVDMTGVSALKEPYNIFRGFNDNCLLYINEWPEIEPKTNVVIGGNATEVLIADDLPFNSPQSFTADMICYTRNCFYDLGWETIVLPFTATELKDENETAFPNYVVETCNGKGSEYVYFTSTSTNNIGGEDYHIVPANTPAIFKLTNGTAGNEDKKTIKFYAFGGEMPVSNITGDVFKGTYTTQTINNSDYYLLDATAEFFAPAAPDATLKAYRCYLDINGGATPARIFHGENPTNVEGESLPTMSIYTIPGAIIINAAHPQLLNVYSVDGRLIQSVQAQAGETIVDGLSQGFYLVNNQKVSVK